MQTVSTSEGEGKSSTKAELKRYYPKCLSEVAGMQLSIRRTSIQEVEEDKRCEVRVRQRTELKGKSGPPKLQISKKKSHGLKDQVESRFQLARERDSPEKSDNLLAPRGIQPNEGLIGHCERNGCPNAMQKKCIFIISSF